MARVGLSLSAAREQLNEVIHWGVFLAVGLLIMGLLAAVLISRHVARPVAALIAGARRIMEGHLDTRVNVHSDDELGQLARAFNGMVAHLAEVMAAHAALNRNLESEVARRTPTWRFAAPYSPSSATSCAR